MTGAGARSAPAAPTRAHGVEAYLPLPKHERRGVALCLSGGGYRAALFHLGALRRLNELGALSRVDTITCVSGGSIIAAQLATHVARLGGWPEPGQRVPGWDDGVAGPLRTFTGRDIRTSAVLRGLNPLGWRNPNVASEALAASYAAGPASASLVDLPERPRFVFCATDMQFRTQWVFDTGRRVMGDDAAGFRPLDDEWTMARAAAASCCVPGVFRPMRVGNRPDALVGGSYEGPDRDALVASIELSDGGVYDNLGLEPVWRDHATVLVSDAAPCFHADPRLGPAWSLLRFPVTLLEQATDVRKRWLISSFVSDLLAGAYWGISSSPSHYGDGGEGDAYSDGLVHDLISQVRIDLDVFSEGEIAVLENHGYLLADIAVRTHAPDLVHAGGAPSAPPHPEWMDERRVAEALAGSARTKMFARRLARLRLGRRRLRTTGR